MPSTSSDAVSPQQFIDRITRRAQANVQHIVLPEGEDDRVLQAAYQVGKLQTAQLSILGKPERVYSRAKELQLDLSHAQVIDPTASEWVEQFARQYTHLREHKGVTLDKALPLVEDVSYFGTFMVHNGYADGMVSGAAHTTAHTIRPALEVIKTQPGISTVSSVFFMCLADQVVVYGDCAIIPDPTSEQLCDIALSSARTAQQFGIDPRVAMLSYSTGASGAGSLVDKVVEATKLVHQKDPQLLCAGPIQYDAACDEQVAAKKLPDSPVAGRATVYIFPDLNAGNITYKAVQRCANALAIGPVLQGIKRPVNDLSRGALVEDIVNTITITAIQAQNDPPDNTTTQS